MLAGRIDLARKPSRLHRTSSLTPESGLSAAESALLSTRVLEKVVQDDEIPEVAEDDLGALALGRADRALDGQRHVRAGPPGRGAWLHRPSRDVVSDHAALASGPRRAASPYAFSRGPIQARQGCRLLAQLDAQPLAALRGAS